MDQLCEKKKNGTFETLGLFLVVGDISKINSPDLVFAHCHRILRNYLQFLLMINSMLNFYK